MDPTHFGHALRACPHVVNRRLVHVLAKHIAVGFGRGVGVALASSVEDFLCSVVCVWFFCKQTRSTAFFGVFMSIISWLLEGGCRSSDHA